ncbi:MAG: FAD:protein FMN transferase [Spirochaetaceae bacterium]|jgi:thiamine biosynthesis lipoprotein|nr:FAD:protein FMN transferase [Spirochaetaceae bacterium]
MVHADTNRRPLRRLCALIFVLVCSAITVSACHPPARTRSGFAFGTVYTVKVYQRVPETLFAEITRRLTGLERIFSPYLPVSDISAVNKNAGIAPVLVNAELIFVAEQALLYAALSDGRFNPAAGPLVRLWDIGSGTERVPPREEIENCLTKLNWQDIRIDKHNSTIYLPHPGMALDLGAIAKGYAADNITQMLKNAGIKKAIIDLGGNIVAIGNKKDPGIFSREQPWHIGIQDPQKPRGTYAVLVPCTNATLVTSGIYERYFEENGKRYHHILSTETGYPVDNELQSVTIISEIDNGPYASMHADALSTTIFTLGSQAGAKLLQKLPGREAIFIFKSGEIRATREGLL